MTAITYIAKRNLVTGAFRVVGTDISADGTLDQFGSTATDLSGLVANNYITVSGFTNSANNGWHIVSGTSSATVLPVAASALVTEAAGSTITIQQYERMAGVSYQLECNPYVLDLLEETDSSESISQGGLNQSIFRRIDSGYQFTTSHITEEDIPQWREFTSSVAGKEPFWFDPFGYISTPDNGESVVMIGNATFQRVRVKKNQSTAKDWRYVISFKVRVL